MLASSRCLSTALLIACGLAQATAADPLADGFKTPPSSAMPRTWWHWTNGHVTTEGITKDLEWMHRVGIGRFQLADVAAGGGQTIDEPLDFGSPKWLAAVKHAAAEAKRLGLEMTIFSSSGWSLTTYATAFPTPAPAAEDDADGRVLLDLGEVLDLAEVRLNGQSLGIAWKPPYRIDVTAALKPAGEDNHLEVAVTNQWGNRILGDRVGPPDQRVLGEVPRGFGPPARDPRPSGLLGPVRLVTETASDTAAGN